MSAPARSRRASHPITTLPFVGDRSPDKPGGISPARDFWKVPEDGGERLGQDYGLAFLRYEAALDHNIHPYILPWIVGDMPRKLSRIEVGFLTVIGIAAAAGLHDAERAVAYWRSGGQPGDNQAEAMGPGRGQEGGAS